MKIYILTSREHKDFYSDDKSLPNAFEAKGLEWELVIWNEENIPDNSTVLVRTIWDYTEHAKDFNDLLLDFEKRGVRVVNPIETLKWNMDKSYLLELEKLGVSIVPTYISSKFDLSSIRESKIDYPVVVKPLVGASGRDTFLLEDENCNVDISALHGRKVMIQPFMKEILTEGEISFLYFGGDFSHAVVKNSKDNEFRIQEEHGGNVKEFVPTDEELRRVQDILDRVPKKWSYARVDVVRDEEEFYLMELELIEPELFFRFSNSGELRLIESLSLL